MISKRVSGISEPETIVMAKKARELVAQGFDIISLSMGEPDFDTPEHIKNAAKAALDANKTHYPPVAGIPELREAVCHKLKRDNYLTYKPENIVVSTGAKHSLMNAVLSLVDPGDEVIVPKPFWVSYKDMIEFAGGVPVFVEAKLENDYKITPEQLEQAITPKSKILIYSNPCNPTGSFYNESELKVLAKVLEKYPRIYVCSDEIYEYINYSGTHFSMAQIPEMFDRTIVINGVSKGYAMTGWRIGYIAAKREIAAACEKIQSQFTSGANSIAQYASVAALGDNLAPSREMTRKFKERRDLVLTLVADIKGIKANVPQGAYYLFPDVSSYFGKKTEKGVVIKDGGDLALYLLNEGHVATVQGSAFGNPKCLRLSFAVANEKLVEAFARMKKTLNKLT